MPLPPNAPDPQSSAVTRSGRSQFVAGAKLSGEMSVPGLMELLGQFEGRMSADAVVIEESGSAIGEIHADRVTVKGRFDGKIFGGDVTIQSGANASGQILYQTLTIESGAAVNSYCSLTRTSLD